jgi:gamma-glutamylcysteine synthetase
MSIPEQGPHAFVPAAPSVGLELEFAVADLASGNSCDASAMFQTLLQRRRTRGEAVSACTAGERLIGVYGQAGVFSVDNGFNNLEYAFAPLGAQFGHGPASQLNRLAWTVHREMNEVMDVLCQHGWGLLNLSEHPTTMIDADLYARLRAPKPIYEHWVNQRDWRHDQGIDAKAQNGPTTGTRTADAVGHLNLMLWVAPALISLFANSPFEAGRLTGLVENRLTIWPRMFASARFPGDQRFHLPPERPFSDLADYFRWMHGPATTMQVLSQQGSYKGYQNLLRVAGDPSLLEFLAGPARPAHPVAGGEAQWLQPRGEHFEQQQYAQFLDARIRYCLVRKPTPEELLEALGDAARLEALFDECGADLYIEGRACGANFPDRQLLALADPDVSASVAIAPAALQKGLLANPRAWDALSRLAPWRSLPALRDAAVREGLRGEADGLALRTFAAQVVEQAAQGLTADEQWMLAYPLHVLRTGHNGADRALSRHEELEGETDVRIRRILAERVAQPLPAPPVPLDEAEPRVEMLA